MIYQSANNLIVSLVFYLKMTVLLVLHLTLHKKNLLKWSYTSNSN